MTYNVIIPKRRQERGNTAAALAALNEVLLLKEWCFETDTGRAKIGDGVTAWNLLPYFDGGFFAAATGADTITATFSSVPVLVDGLQVRLRAAAANTTAVTFNPNGLGALAVKKTGGVALVAGEIYGAGHELILRYVSGSPGHRELLNPAIIAEVGARAGDATTGTWVIYSGTVSTSGMWDGGTTDPTHTTFRLNFDGKLFATEFHGAHIGDGSGLTGIVAGAIGQYDLPQVFQLALGRGNVGIRIAANATGTTTGFGFDTSSVTTGTGAAVTMTDTNTFSRQSRSNVTAAASSAGNTASFSYGGLIACGDGGHLQQIGFGIADAAAVADARLFVGWYHLTTVIGNVDPSSLTDLVGIGCDHGETTLSIIHNDASGTATKVSLGANFPCNTQSTDYYILTTLRLAGASSMTYHVLRVNTGDTASGVLSSNLPTASTFLANTWWRNSGATALAVKLAVGNLFNKWNMES